MPLGVSLNLHSLPNTNRAKNPWGHLGSLLPFAEQQAVCNPANFNRGVEDGGSGGLSIINSTATNK